MPALLIFFGIVLFVSAYHHNTPALGAQLVTDIAGFAKWAAAIVAIGLLQYVPGFEKPARALMLLVALVIFLTNGSGFFSQLQQAFAEFAASTAGAATTPSQVSQSATATVAAEKAVSALSTGVTAVKITTGGASGGTASNTGAVSSLTGGLF